MGGWGGEVRKRKRRKERREEKMNKTFCQKERPATTILPYARACYGRISSYAPAEVKGKSCQRFWIVGGIGSFVRILLLSVSPSHYYLTWITKMVKALDLWLKLIQASVGRNMPPLPVTRKCCHWHRKRVEISLTGTHKTKKTDRSSNPSTLFENADPLFVAPFIT